VQIPSFSLFLRLFSLLAWIISTVDNQGILDQWKMQEIRANIVKLFERESISSGRWISK